MVAPHIRFLLIRWLLSLSKQIPGIDLDSIERVATGVEFFMTMQMVRERCALYVEQDGRIQLGALTGTDAGQFAVVATVAELEHGFHLPAAATPSSKPPAEAPADKLPASRPPVRRPSVSRPPREQVPSDGRHADDRGPVDH